MTLSVKCLALFFLLLPLSVQANTRTASYLVEAETGKVLFSENANDMRYPASLTKMMSLYLVFDALEKGQIQMQDKMIVSRKASKMPRSRLGLRANSTITVEHLIYAMISRSANDAAVVIAEGVATSEEEFAKKMTRVAKELGMKNSSFKNASGLHNKDQYTTAQDMAILSLALIQHFPKYYKMFDMKGFWYKRRYYGNHNLVARYFKGGDGLKTGYVDASGYHVVGSAVQNDKRLIGVVMGRNSVRQRDRDIFKLLKSGFKALKDNQKKLASSKEKPFFKPMKEVKTFDNQKEYRHNQVATKKIIEHLDLVSSFDSILKTYPLK